MHGPEQSCHVAEYAVHQLQLQHESVVLFFSQTVALLLLHKVCVSFLPVHPVPALMIAPQRQLDQEEAQDIDIVLVHRVCHQDQEHAHPCWVETYHNRST